MPSQSNPRKTRGNAPRIDALRTTRALRRDPVGHRACVSLPGGSATTPECARGIVRAWLAAWQIPAESACDTVLIVSELTTNAVVHTESSQITMAVQITGRGPRRLTIRVIDQGPPCPDRIDRRAGGGDALALSGRGLFLVGWAQLAIPVTAAKAAYEQSDGMPSGSSGP